MIKIQANISGYHGKPCSVMGAYDEETGILVIARTLDLMPRHEDSVLLCSDTRADNDGVFGFEQLRGGIDAYFRLKTGMAEDGRSALLRFSDSGSRADPAIAIERDGVDMNGPIYRINAGATNANVAALAICRFVLLEGVSGDLVDMTDALAGILAGRAMTI